MFEIVKKKSAPNNMHNKRSTRMCGILADKIFLILN